MKPQEMNLDDWIRELDLYKQTPGYKPGAAMRIENTMFTSAHYFGGMTYNDAKYTYFEPEIPGHAPNADGTPYVAWLMVREDFLRWVCARMEKAAGGGKHATQAVQAVQAELPLQEVEP